MGKKSFQMPAAITLIAHIDIYNSRKNHGRNLRQNLLLYGFYLTRRSAQLCHNFFLATHNVAQAVKHALKQLPRMVLTEPIGTPNRFST